MRKAALLGVLSFAVLGGCDVVVVTAVLLSQQDDSSDDAPPPGLPIVTVTATDAAAAEAGPDTGTFEIVRTGDTSAALDVSFTFTSGSGFATPGSDYVAIASPATIPAGSDRVTLTVTPLDDLEVEGPENVEIDLSPGTGYATGSPEKATVAITSDDAPPNVTVSATVPNASEVGPSPGEFTFMRSVVTAGSLEVFFSISGTAESSVDYVALPASVTIPGGSPSVTLAVTPIDDPLLESSESVIVTISDNPQYTHPIPAVATVTIQSEDDSRYHVWVADLAAGAEATARTNLISAFGNPDTGVWTEVGVGTASAEFTPTGGRPFNTILIQFYDTVVYNLDAVEILNASGTVVGTASAPTFSDKMSKADDLTDMLGTPDGLTEVSAATPTARAFAFTRYTTSFSSFRVNVWPDAGPRAPGDVQWEKTLTRPSNQSAGGAAVAASGMVYASFRDDTSRNVYLVRYSGAGVLTPEISIETVTTNSVGSHSVAIDQANSFVYVASTGSSGGSAGDIRVRRYDLSMGGMTLIREINGSPISAARVEANGITVDGAGNVLVAGGAVQGLEGINHWIWKLTSAGADVAGFPISVMGDTTDTWWHGVSFDGSNNIFTAGDHREGALTQPDLFLHRTLSAGVNDWDLLLGASGAPDLGTAVGVDGSGNVYVTGYQDAGPQGRDGIISKRTNTGGFIAGFPIIHAGPGGGDDEILDIAVESDGTFYAVGYEAVTGQGQNWWVRKYSSTGGIVWTRTHHHAPFTEAGNDRAVSVSISSGHIVVVGQVTLAGGAETEIHVRKYVK